MKKYIKCPTQEIWDFVYQNSNMRINNNWDIYEELSGLCFEDNEYCIIEYYEKNEYSYIEVTLSDYCLEKGIANPFEMDNEKLLTIIL